MPCLIGKNCSLYPNLSLSLLILAQEGQDRQLRSSVRRGPG
jgi:hypothetical protein